MINHSDPKTSTMTAQSFKQALATAPQYGLFSNIVSAHAAEALADSGFDFLIFDGEHAPADMPMMHALLMALNMKSAPGPTAGPPFGIIRVPSRDGVAIKQCLDMGADGIMVPMVDTPEQARAVVAWTRYPPAGARGIHGVTRATRYGRDKNYAATAGEHHCIILQIESPLGMSNLDAICAVEGVDALFFGPSDYAANSGRLGQPTHPEVQDAVEAGVRRVRANGRIAGVFCSEANASRFATAGATLLAVGVDLAILVNAADALAARLKGR